MNTISFSGLVTNSEPECPLEFSIILDNKVVLEPFRVFGTHSFSISMDDDETEHELKLVMSGKNKNDTVVNSDGELIKNPMLVIEQPKFDNIDMSLYMIANSIYTHNFNGTQPTIKDSYGGCMGCNGEVAFKFNTPIYLWLMDVVM